jgi:hypothetical protein
MNAIQRLVEHHRARAEEYQARAMQCDAVATVLFLQGEADFHGRAARFIEAIDKVVRSLEVELQRDFLEPGLEEAARQKAVEIISEWRTILRDGAKEANSGSKSE